MSTNFQNAFSIGFGSKFATIILHLKHITTLYCNFFTNSGPFFGTTLYDRLSYAVQILTVNSVIHTPEATVGLGL